MVNLYAGQRPIPANLPLRYPAYALIFSNFPYLRLINPQRSEYQAQHLAVTRFSCLRQFVIELSSHFQASDLFWGVNEDSSLNQQGAAAVLPGGAGGVVHAPEGHVALRPSHALQVPVHQSHIPASSCNRWTLLA
jgi:hypothetical protein